MTYTATYTANANTTIAKAVVSVDGKWTDAAGNPGAASQSASFLVDTIAPTVKQVVAIPGSGTLNAGQSGLIDLVTSENVKVSGAELLLSNGGVATYDATRSTGTSLVFDYTVGSNQGTSKKPVSVVGVEYLAGGYAQDTAGNAAVLSGAASSLGFAVAGTASNPASVTVDAGATAENFGASNAAAGFQSSTGTLQLDDWKDFKGTVAGLSAAGTNSLDLVGFSSVSAKTVSYTANTTGQAGGKLTVTNSANQTASIQLLGSYSLSSFKLADDGHGGTTLYDPKTPVASHGSALTKPV